MPQTIQPSRSGDTLIRLAKPRDAGAERVPRPRAVLVAIVAGLLLVAALPRFANLGALSFYGDEETSALAARSVAEGKGPRMPSGMPYLRALPLTYATAASARVFGLDREFSYRFPTAILGCLSVAFLFLLARTLAETDVAIVAAVLLALSEWDLAFARQARMYVPFVLAYLATALFVWRWAKNGRRHDLMLAVASFLLTISLHELGIMAVLFAAAPLVLLVRPRISASRLVGFVLVGTLIARMYSHLVIDRGYAVLGSLGAPSERPPLLELIERPWIAALSLAGAVAAGWISWRCRADRWSDADRAAVWIREASCYASACAAGAAIGAGQLYGASLAVIVFLVIHTGSRRKLLRDAWMPLAILAVISATWCVVSVTQLGPFKGLRALALFPFPYSFFVAEQFPLVMCLAMVAGAWELLPAQAGRNDGLRLCILAVVLPTAAAGALLEWGGTRYLIHTYPFLLILAAVALIRLVRLATDRAHWRPGIAGALAIVIAASGALGAHGVPQAIHIVRLRHGEPIDAQMHMFPFRPDHAGPGRFVRDVRAPGDILIAEDALEQYWYAGIVDYWLRGSADVPQYAYRAKDGAIRDIYVNSAVAPAPPAIDSMARSTGGRVWLVTSGETLSQRDYYLDPDQRRWLDSVETFRLPAFIGRDKATKVYCLNCVNGTLERIGAAAHEAREAAGGRTSVRASDR